jgi:hypothetical protein
MKSPEEKDKTLSRTAGLSLSAPRLDFLDCAVMMHSSEFNIIGAKHSDYNH